MRQVNFFQISLLLLMLYFYFYFLPGCALMGLSWLCAAICVYVAALPAEKRLLESNDHSSRNIAIVSVYASQFFFGCSLCVYAFAFSLSVGSVSSVFGSEVFPYRMRAKAASTCMALYFFSNIFTPSLKTLSVANIGIWGEFRNRPTAGAIGAIGAIGAPSSAAAAAAATMVTATATSTAVPHGFPSVTEHAWAWSDHISSFLSSVIGSVVGGGHSGGDNSKAVITSDFSAASSLLQLSMCCLLLGLFVYLFIPETKGGLICFFMQFFSEICYIYLHWYISFMHVVCTVSLFLTSTLFNFYLFRFYYFFIVWVWVCMCV